jgi:hypothetical protein
MRLYVDDPDNRWTSWHDGADIDQPADGVAEVAIERRGETINVTVGGESFSEGAALPLTGVTRWLYVGGTRDSGRGFRGEWRNLKAIPPEILADSGGE